MIQNPDAIRPLKFVRIRVYRGGQAEYLSTLMHDERKALLDDLAALRAEGKPESDAEVTETRDKIMFLVNALRDLDSALVSLAGPDEDPRER